MARDTLKAVRADMAREKAEADARIKKLEDQVTRWCCGKPKKSQPAPPPPPASQPPPTPTPDPITPTYPKSIVDAGLQNVWNLQTLAGPSVTPTKRLGSDTLPSGAGFDGSSLSLTAACSLAGWVIDHPFTTSGAGSYTVNISEAALSLPAGNDDYNGRIGKDDASNAVTLNLTRCAVNANAPNAGGGFVSRPWSITNATWCAFLDAGMNHFRTFNGGSLTDCYFRGEALSSPPDGHHEQVKFDGLDATATRCFFDLRYGTLAGGGSSGNVFWGGGNGDGELVFTDCIFVGVARYNGLFTIQYRCDASVVRLKFVNCVFEKGVSGYIGKGPGPVAVVEAVGCRDFLTSENIDAQLIAAGA